MSSVPSFVAALALLGISAPTAAQSDGPYKLVITWYQSVVVIDYPSLARCERAKQVLIERARARAVATGLPPESGDIAQCIPG